MKTLCGAVGLSRQGYYKQRKARQRRRIDEEAIVELVRRERALQPRLGARKLLVLLSGELEEMGIRIGRDRFLEVLRRRGLLIERRRRSVRTTQSVHSFRTYPNLYRETQLTGAHQAWVSDLTYVRTEEGFEYVWLISDAYSRKIVGHCAWHTAEAVGGLKALKKALGQLPEGAHPLHHSDRGIQYCCWDYVELLQAHGIAISMTEEDHCYENAQAERVNGILKQEYGLGETFVKRAQVRRALNEAVMLYNGRRPHTSLGYRTPQAVHAAAA